MQMTKAENMVTHAKEIAARPPRSWFQTGKEKQAEAELSAAARGEASSTAGRRAAAKLERLKEKQVNSLITAVNLLITAGPSLITTMNSLVTTANSLVTAVNSLITAGHSPITAGHSHSPITAALSGRTAWQREER
eukprot:103445-Prorocentrum_minimum.AAC.1